MQIIEIGKQRYRATLSEAEARIFINGMNETLQRISAREYPTRMGAEIDEIRRTIASLEAALK